MCQVDTTESLQSSVDALTAERERLRGQLQAAAAASADTPAAAAALAAAQQQVASLGNTP